MRKVLTLLLCALVLSAEPSPPYPYEVVPDQNCLQVLSPSLQSRTTVKIRLANGLEAILLSDPKISHSAAAVAVEVGSWEDPAEYPGMAHFVEHLLFMGTQKYPGESEYQKYIEENGGSWNAYTVHNRTVYGFSIQHHAFVGALDRFSRFFIDPLFRDSSLERELHAIDQEYRIHLQNDDRRKIMVLKTTGNPDHPNCAFTIGNRSTLSAVSAQELQRWYQSNYSGNRMHLIVLSSLPIEDLKQQVVRCFSPVANEPCYLPNYPSSLFSEQQKGHFLYIEPIKNGQSLDLLWEIPKKWGWNLESQSTDWVCDLFNHGISPNLQNQLLDARLGSKVTAAMSHLSLEHHILSISISLTPSGLKQLDAVIHYAFQAIHQLQQQAPPQYLFDEWQKMDQIRYAYPSPSNPFKFVMKEAAEMIYEPLESYPSKMRVAQVYDPVAASQLLQQLTPASCLFCIVADPKELGIELPYTEPWMGTRYGIQPLSPEQLSALTNIPSQDDTSFRDQNPYIPRTLQCLNTSEMSHPVVIAEDSLGRLYYQGDSFYQVPEAAVHMRLKTPWMDGSARGTVVAQLYAMWIRRAYRSEYELAHLAGVQREILPTPFAIQLGFSGYSEPIFSYARTLFQSLRQKVPDEKEFELSKADLLLECENATKNLPIWEADALLLQLLQGRSITGENRRELENLSYTEFLSSITDPAVYIEGMVYGNVEQEETKAFWIHLKNLFPNSPFPKAEHRSVQVWLPSTQAGPYSLLHESTQPGSAVTLALYQGPFSFENKAAQQILSLAFKSDFFESLRTKQQTCYIARSPSLATPQSLWQFFQVQSNTHTSVELLTRFELFVEEYYQNLTKNIPESRFRSLQQTAINSWSHHHCTTLAAQGASLAELAFSWEGDFDLSKKGATAIENLSYDSFLLIARNWISKNNRQRVAILVDKTHPLGHPPQYTPLSPELIEAGYYSSDGG